MLLTLFIVDDETRCISITLEAEGRISWELVETNRHGWCDKKGWGFGGGEVVVLINFLCDLLFQILQKLPRPAARTHLVCSLCA